jgi:hypothetical protein
MARRQPRAEAVAATSQDPDETSPDVPDSVVARVKASFARRMEGELAALVVDSLVEQGDPAANHHLRFEHPLGAIDVYVSAIATGADLAVGTQPPMARRVQLVDSQGGLRRVAELTEGSFVFRQVPHAVICLTLLSSDDSPAIHTDWFRV